MISPLYVGDLAPIFTVVLRQDGQVANIEGPLFPLAGVLASAFSMVIYNPTTGSSTTGVGIFAITSIPLSTITYALGLGDTVGAGDFQFFVTLQTAHGPQTWDPLLITILPK